MNILVANWTWYPSGGDWTYIDSLCRVYAAHGHRVVPFSLQHERNHPTEFAQYFLPRMDYKEMQSGTSPGKILKVLRSSIYSGEARRQLRRLLTDCRIDVAHLHNINRYLTTSIIPLLHDEGIPIVWTLHDYVLLCPEATFISKGSVCEACKGGRFFECTIRRCKKNSLPASLVATIENYVSTALNYYRYVDYFIAPSRFLQAKFIEYGFPQEKCVWIPNCLDTKSTHEPVPDPGDSGQPYMLYVGRIENVKGIFTLLDALQRLPHVRCRIAGFGSGEEELRQRIGATGGDRIQFLGRTEPSEVHRLMRMAAFTVCPSEWYENLPYSVVEAMLWSRPVIGAEIGGIPELVINEHTGLLFAPGNVAGLVSAIERLWNDAELRQRLGRRAREHVLQLVDPVTHYQRLEHLFNTASGKTD
jgi:glycosyltransferase involved in cell wall biosynthesis